MPRYTPSEDLEISLLREEIYDLKCKIDMLERQQNLSRIDPNLSYDARNEPKILDYSYEEFRLACTANISRQPFGYHVILRGGTRPDNMIELRYMITDDQFLSRRDVARYLAEMHKKIMQHLVGQLR